MVTGNSDLSIVTLFNNERSVQVTDSFALQQYINDKFTVAR